MTPGRRLHMLISAITANATDANAASWALAAKTVQMCRANALPVFTLVLVACGCTCSQTRNTSASASNADAAGQVLTYRVKLVVHEPALGPLKGRLQAPFD